MARKTNSNAPNPSNAPLPSVQVSEPEVASAPPVKKTKKPVDSSVAAVPEVPSIPATNLEEELKNETVVVSETEKKGEITSRFGEFAAKLHNATVQLNSLRTEFKQLEKQLLKDIKSLQKSKGKKNKSTSGNRKPSGFTCPTPISNELAAFLGKPDGIEIARTEVSKELTKYIHDHQLKDPANGKNILPDEKLRTLLKLGKDDKLTIFSIHRYLVPHFVKSASATA